MPSENEIQPSFSPMPGQEDDWREIAERASQEPDAEKVVKLVEDLCQKLEEREAQRKRTDPAGH